MRTLWSCMLAMGLMAFETLVAAAMVVAPVAALRRRRQ